MEGPEAVEGDDKNLVLPNAEGRSTQTDDLFEGGDKSNSGGNEGEETNQRSNSRPSAGSENHPGQAEELKAQVENGSAQPVAAADSNQEPPAPNYNQFMGNIVDFPNQLHHQNPLEQPIARLHSDLP